MGILDLAVYSRVLSNRVYVNKTELKKEILCIKHEIGRVRFVSL